MQRIFLRVFLMAPSNHARPLASLASRLASRYQESCSDQGSFEWRWLPSSVNADSLAFSRGEDPSNDILGELPHRRLYAHQAEKAPFRQY